MSLSTLFDRRVRGMRVINLFGAAVLLVLVIGLYLIKTFAGGERADIQGTQDQIVAEQRQIRELRAEVAYLEQPQRIERLAAPLNLQPIPGRHEVPASELNGLAKTGGPPK